MYTLKSVFKTRGIFFVLTTLCCQIAVAQADKVMWFAHRGFIGLHPENTIEGMKRAMKYDGVILEMDLAITKDKQVVVSHDPVLNPKITLNANGSELSSGEKIAIYNTPYEQLKNYDVGTKPHPVFLHQMRYKAGIPRLADLIDSLENYAVKEGLALPYYFIETKLKPENDGKYHPDAEEFTSLALAVILEKKIQQRVIIQSFDPRTLQIIHKKYPEIPLAFLSKAGTTLEDNLKWLGFVPTYYSSGPDLITAELIEKCRNAGTVPMAGSLKSYEQYLRLASLGIKRFITDYPIDYLKNMKK